MFDVVLVGYRAADTRSALRLCDRLFDPASGGRRLLVLNRPDLAEEVGTRSAGWTTVYGSNRLAEFSGWQEGLDLLNIDKRGDVGVVFANDTICAHRDFTNARACAFTRTARACGPSSLVGFRDKAWHHRLEIAALEFGSWISTYCFMLTPAALQALDYKIYEPEAVANCVPGGTSEEEYFDRLSPELERHLRRWLFGGGWYGAGRLTPDNASRLLLKARCIAAELLLSARCRSVGVDACDPFDIHPRLELLDRIQRRLRRHWRASLGLESRW